jgi:F420-non-reducing hydrogenase small subunit
MPDRDSAGLETVAEIPRSPRDNGKGGKARWAFFTLSGCRGCETLLLDVNYQIAPIADMADVAFWPWLLGSRRDDLAALPDGALDAAFVAGAVRTPADEEAASLLRAKARRLIAFGACAAFGGIPGLTNVAPTEGERVRSLGQVVEVDYVVPGCPPPANFAWAALQSLAAGDVSSARLSYLANMLPRAAASAVLAGLEPPRGTVFAGDKAVCAACSRVKEEKKITAVYRPHAIAPEPARCLLEQGVICVGLATRGGCGGRCTAMGLPCRGCFGPAEAVPDPGANLVTAIASTIASDDPARIAAIVEDIVDPLGTFYRYSLPQAMLQPKAAPVAPFGQGGDYVG